MLFIGIAAGAYCGWQFGPAMKSVAWMGTFFLNALKMLIVPLIVSSMIVGISSMGDVRKLGRQGGTIFIYYFATTGMAVFLGIIMVNIFQPGVGVELSETAVVPETVAGKEQIGPTDILLSLISPNIVKSAAELQILPLIVFSLCLGGILTTIGEKGQTVIRFFDGLNEALMKFVELVMYIAPIGVFGLVASKLGDAGGGEAFWGELVKIGKYSLTVLVGLGVHALVVLPILLTVLARRNPFRYGLGMLPAVGTAWSTASSSATLPVTLECAEERNKVSRRSALFVLPLGATINMDGTALYEAVAAIFIAQAVGIDLSAGQQVVIFLTATLAAVGAAGIPQAGLVTMVIVLKAVNLPLEGIGLILAVDWFLDRFRTCVNVWGDSVGAAVLDRFFPSGGRLERNLAGTD
ncbi:MAG: dicarboxylate/amino acid:cation symporter [Candidatus Eisenbacteria bacterium]|uniref:Dicarboxylate/amino acid:cation symporter n=1 Tax=Eiseniibacteriota bacterium TaxID=2212470 RepID=A0A7Y2H2V2_UNCEI|nr:dicarboxylate/amino acid:cation symporter [Candidatus Eisenbacteria bacterium]